MLHTGSIDHVVTSATSSLDGGTVAVAYNVWIVGDEREVIVIDPAHDGETIAEGIADRQGVAVVSTHAHTDHVNQASALADRFDAPILLNRSEEPLRDMTHRDRLPDRQLRSGEILRVGGITLRAIMAPGHSPGFDLPLRREPWHAVLRRHIVRGWSRRDGSVVLVL
jgi:glyoxylase-like metal-dependent hydrolase (beta-lactamase superfamily II)